MKSESNDKNKKINNDEILEFEIEELKIENPVIEIEKAEVLSDDFSDKNDVTESNKEDNGNDISEANQDIIEPSDEEEIIDDTPNEESLSQEQESDLNEEQDTLEELGEEGSKQETDEESTTDDSNNGSDENKEDKSSETSNETKEETPEALPETKDELPENNEKSDSDTSEVKEDNENSSDNNKNESEPSNKESNEGENESQKDSSDSNKTKNDSNGDNDSNKNSNSEQTKSNENNINKGTDNNKKQVPENLQNKRDKVKNAWENRPKNMNDVKDRMKSGGKNLADKTKNGIKNGAKNMANRAKDGAKNAVENSQAAQKVNEAKEKIEKTKKAAEKAKKTIKAVKTTISAISAAFGGGGVVLLVILAIIAVVAIVMAIFSPGSRGDAASDNSGYSKTDQKTLEKIRDIVDDYPSVDASLAMSAVVYPYFDILWSKPVKDNVSQEYLDEISEDSVDDGEETEIDEEEIEQEEKNGHDPYLELFRKNSYRKNFKKLLKKLSSGEQTLETYLKDTYFGKEKAYKSMLDGVSNYDALVDAMVQDIKDNSPLFVNYVFESSVCSTNLVSAGTVEIEDMLKGNILVDVKVPSCSSSKGVWDCESVYSSPITLKQYVFGGTYEEFNSMDVEKTAAQMLAIKSYIVQRGKNMGWGIKQDSNGNYVVTARNNTNDLVYCDVDLGCNSGNTEVGAGNRKRDPISSEQRAVFEAAWEKIANKYIYDNESKKTVGSFCQSRSGSCDFCKKGSCLAHQELESYTNTTYDAIIGIQYSNYAVIEVEGDYANVMLAGNTSCSNVGNLDIDDSKFVYYAQTDYPNVPFCGLKTNYRADTLCPKGNTICSHGCGITSMAMVTSTLTQNYTVNPLTLNNEVRPGMDCGTYGSTGGILFPYIANKYGLTYSFKGHSSNIINDIKQALDEGALIITSVCGGVKLNGTYTSGKCGGHFIVIRGYEGDSVIISDPYQNSRLKNFNSCLLKQDGKCVKHKMSFDSFYNDLDNKRGGIHIIKGTIPFSELKNQGNEEANTEVISE